MAIRDDILKKLDEGIHALNANPTYGSVTIADVIRYWPSITQLNDEQLPLVVIDDNGNVPGPDYRGVARFKTNLNVSAIVRSGNQVDLNTQIENISDALTKYMYSQPSLHTQCLDVMMVERADLGIFSRSDRHYATVLLAIRILWYETVKTVAAPVGTDVYGTQWIDDARDKLKARLDALKTTMATGYDPTFSYVHERHLVPDLKLNAVSIGFEGVDDEPFGGSATGVSVTHLLDFTVRIHTAYDDQLADEQETARLMNSIINKLRAQVNLTGGYWIRDIGDIDSNLSFDESESQGGTFTVTIETHVLHAQE